MVLKRGNKTLRMFTLVEIPDEKSSENEETPQDWLEEETGEAS
jgi:hypothetical protein